MRRVSVILLVCCMLSAMAFAGFGADRTPYHTPEQIKALLENKAGKAGVKLHTLAKSPGGRPLQILQIGSGDRAVLVTANMNGDSPMASQAAVTLIDKLTGEWSAEQQNFTWYVCPVGNPDGYARFFSSPLDLNVRNSRPINDDNDDATDEDGPDDLNRDGFITMMRQRHPEGTWIADEEHAPIMRQAEHAKGEKGIYRLFPEGLDNDGDGKINEDGKGGVIVGHNFPHQFKNYTRTDGPWSASEDESRALLRFTLDHPEIGLVLTFGRANTLMAVPESKTAARAGSDKIRVSSSMARYLGVEGGQEYPVNELLEIARSSTGNPNLSEDQLRQWMGGGAATTPAKGDAEYWKAIVSKYEAFIKEAGLDARRLKPSASSNGSFEEWAYYQYGVMSFAMDFWTLPEPEKEAKEEAAAKDKKPVMPKKTEEEKIKMDPEKEALFKFDPKGFVPWSAFDHPTLGPVEIGGMIPYRNVCPPDTLVKPLIEKQLPVIRELTGAMAQVDIARVEVKNLGKDVWRVEAWVTNKGYFPYPTHQGARNRRPVGAIIEIKGEPEILEGKKRQTLGLIEGSGGSIKTSWLFAGKSGSKITLTVKTMSAGTAEKAISLKGGIQ